MVGCPHCRGVRVGIREPGSEQIFGRQKKGTLLLAITRLRFVGRKLMTQTTAATTFKSPLHEMTQTTPTCLWNDSASIAELTYSIEHGAVGATCNPVIVLGVLKKEMGVWKDRKPPRKKSAGNWYARSPRKPPPC